MTVPPIKLVAPLPGLYADRQGIAALTRLAYGGDDLRTVRLDLARRVTFDRHGAGMAMDLAAVMQLMGDKPGGLAIQARILLTQAIYRSPCAAAKPRLRLLAFAADLDIGSNTPLEFLLSGSDIELFTLYLQPGQPPPLLVPNHDVAIVALPDDERCRGAIGQLLQIVPQWQRPVLNLPQQVALLDRDRLHLSLHTIPGVIIPDTRRLSRDNLACLEFVNPLVVRPVGSHAGFGLARLDRPQAIASYLAGQTVDMFFIAPFVDYRSGDGLFRKYRIVFIDGRPFACHMAISSEWKIWYLNAGMEKDEGKRREEASFFDNFDRDFAVRHGAALAEVARRIGLDYVAIDCAECRDGRLLIFEADNTMIVHDMDPPALFPYKPPQMRKIFEAFQAMLHRRAGSRRSHAA